MPWIPLLGRRQEELQERVERGARAWRPVTLSSARRRGSRPAPVGEKTGHPLGKVVDISAVGLPQRRGLQGRKELQYRGRLARGWSGPVDEYGYDPRTPLAGDEDLPAHPVAGIGEAVGQRWFIPPGPDQHHDTALPAPLLQHTWANDSPSPMERLSRKTSADGPSLRRNASVTTLAAHPVSVRR